MELIFLSLLGLLRVSINKTDEVNQLNYKFTTHFLLCQNL